MRVCQCRSTNTSLPKTASSSAAESAKLMSHNPVCWRSHSYVLMVWAAAQLASSTSTEVQCDSWHFPLPWNPDLFCCDITTRALIGHQMSALIGFWPKLCRLNHWLSATLDADPAHLHCPTNTHTHNQNTCTWAKIQAHNKYGWHSIKDVHS